MILAVDVDYRDGCASVGGITFENWTDGNEKDAFASFLDNVNDYIPGQFYRRELPYRTSGKDVQWLKDLIERESRKWGVRIEKAGEHRLVLRNAG